MASTWNTSFIAAWLAPPPIQLPVSVVMPRQVSPATVSGCTRPITLNDTTAPSITPRVPVRNITSAFGHSRTMPPMSIDTQNSTSDAGSR